MNNSARYFIDCSKMSNSDYEKVKSSLMKVYDFCDVYLERPHCLILTLCSMDPPLDKVFTPPTGCIIHRLS